MPVPWALIQEQQQKLARVFPHTWSVSQVLDPLPTMQGPRKSFPISSLLLETEHDARVRKLQLLA